jgi:hypothetical protein
MTAMDGGNANRLPGAIFATAMDGGNANRLPGAIFASPAGKASAPAHAPRQLLLHCSTTVRPVHITYFPVGIKKAPCGAFFVNRTAVLSNLTRSSRARFYYTDSFAVKRTTGFENHIAVCFSKQRVVTTHAYVSACVEFSATLANQNVAGDNYLSTEFLNAESF